ncbi:MAG: hypothetical protein WAT79_02755 [Saprospiraceae bacterium]
MKSVKSVLFVVGLALISSFGHASSSNSFRNPEGIQIQKMLMEVGKVLDIEKGSKINISFLVNAQNEIIVLSTNNADYDKLIKNVLNYQKISISELNYNTVYTIPVVFK